MFLSFLVILIKKLLKKLSYTDKYLVLLVSITVLLKSIFKLALFF
jgi:hypothetical protein